MINIKIVGDREIIFDLERINRQAPGAMRQIIGRSALQVKREAMLNLSGRMLKVRTTLLRSSIKIIFGGQKNSPYAIVGTNIVYAAVHEFGATIPPRTIFPRYKKALYWPGADHPIARVNMPQIRIPARPFMKAAFDASLPVIEKIAKEEIERLIR